MTRRFLPILAVMSLAATAFAKIELGTPFADGMVLQRERDVPVWGKATAGRKVTVSFAGKSVSAVASADGRWRVKLPPMAASKESRTLSVAEQGGDAAVVKDVLVGEVWLCSGQSNADCPIWGGNPRYRDGWGVVTLTSVNKPFVRLVKTPRYPSLKPRYGYRAEWLKMTPDLYSVWKERDIRLPSAVGYYYALELANALDIPIGLVDSSVGGTSIDTWTPPSGYEGLSGLELERDWKTVSEKDWKPEMRKAAIFGWVQQPALLWNGMVAAYAPMACRGMIWYQGCANTGEYQRYCTKMHALYNGWSKEFENPGLKFYFAQLAPWGYAGIANIQMSQAQFEREERNAAMAVINDSGNLHDIHPNDKRVVAKRLALHALRRDYGWTSVRDNSPTLRSWRIDGNRFVLAFNDADGLYVYNPDGSPETGFEICGVDGQWKHARIVNLDVTRLPQGKSEIHGSVVGKELVLEAEGVAAPLKLRYLHAHPWYGAVYSDAGLPLGVFSIDGEKGAVSPAAIEPVPRLRLGILSDPHVVTRERGLGGQDSRGFEKALRLFDERRADAVLVAGDLTDFGTPAALKRVAEIWFRVFPGGRRSDGAPIVQLFHFGDHDMGGYAHKWEWAKPRCEDSEELKTPLPETDVAAIWEECFHEKWAPVQVKTVRGYTFVLAHHAFPTEANGKSSFVPGLAELLAGLKPDAARPFFYSQHWMLRGTVGTPEDGGFDSGRTTEILGRYPNAIAFCGHGHRNCADELNLWQGAFTAIEVPSVNFCCTRTGRENGLSKRNKTYDFQMPKADPRESFQGLFATVFDDRMSIERWDVRNGGKLGPDWEIRLPRADGFASAESRAKRMSVPQFPPDAKVSVSAMRGKNRRGEPTDQVVVTFPVARADGECAYAYDYEVTAKTADGKTVVKRVYAPDMYRSRQTNPVTCVFAVRELAGKGKVDFEIRPEDGFGRKGRPLTGVFASDGEN